VTETPHQAAAMREHPKWDLCAAQHMFHSEFMVGQYGDDSQPDSAPS
jgi:hypothetical protein